MNGLIIVLYVAGFTGIVISLLLAAKRSGTVRTTSLLIATWSCIVIATVYTGEMNVLVALGNMAFLYLLLLAQMPANFKKNILFFIKEDTQDALATTDANLAQAADDETKLMEQAAHLQQLKITIENYFNSNLPFRKHGYSISNLSMDTGIPVYQLSAVINQEFGMNFNELINSYRVTYLTNILQDSFDLQSYTLEALGKMAGFNSRTTFIAAIKKHTGMTPSSFFNNKKNIPIKKVEKQEAFLMKEVA